MFPALRYPVHAQPPPQYYSPLQLNVTFALDPYKCVAYAISRGGELETAYTIREETLGEDLPHRAITAAFPRQLRTGLIESFLLRAISNVSITSVSPVTCRTPPTSFEFAPYLILTGSALDRALRGILTLLH